MDEKLTQLFLTFCKTNKFEINPKQKEIIVMLENFIFSKKNFLNIFKKKEKFCFYLYGGVGVGKTMLLNFFYNSIKIKKNRIHFNEFMVNFHDYRHQEKNYDPLLQKK